MSAVTLFRYKVEEMLNSSKYHSKISHPINREDNQSFLENDKSRPDGLIPIFKYSIFYSRQDFFLILVGTVGTQNALDVFFSLSQNWELESFSLISFTVKLWTWDWWWSSGRHSRLVLEWSGVRFLRLLFPFHDNLLLSYIWCQRAEKR